MKHRLLALVFVGALASAACADDGATDTGGDTGATTDDADDSAADATTPTEGDTAGDDTAGEDTSDDGSDDAPLTASFRGVTEAEILIGVGFVDATDFGFNSGDIEGQWQAAIDGVNEAGGVNGRMLRPIFDSFSPVGAVEPEATCVKFTQDEMVFAFVGFVREDNEVCYTEQSDTIAVNTDGATNEAIERSNGLLFTTEPTKLGLELLAIDAAAEAGLVDGERVHIHASAADEPLVERIQEALEANGAEITATSIQVTTPGDVPATEAENDTILQRALADDATSIYAVADAGLGITGAVQRAGADVTAITTHDNDQTYPNFGYDPSAIDLKVFAPEPPEAVFDRGEAGLEECVSRFEASSGETVNIGEVDPDPDNFQATIRACRGIDLFVAIATAAGNELTNETFLDAADSLGSFDLTGAAAASMDAGKVGADDSPLVLLDWDPDSLSFVAA